MYRRCFLILLTATLLSFPTSSALATDDISFTTTRLNDFASTAVWISNKIGFDIGGLIVPIFTKEKEIATPDFQPTAEYKKSFVEYFTPQNYKDDGKHIDWDEQENPIFYTALYGAILKVDAEHSDHPEPTDCYISEKMEKSSDVPFAPLAFQKAREADASLGINPVDPDENGVIDFNLPSAVIGGMKGAEDCKKHDAGFERTKLENESKQLAEFGGGTSIWGSMTTTIMIAVTKIIQGVETVIQDYLHVPEKREVILTMKKKQPYHSIQTHDGGGPEREAGKYSGNSAKSGGWAAFTLREEDKKEVPSSSLQPYEITVAGFRQKPLEAAYDLFNISQVRQQQASCYMVPDTTNTSLGNLQDNVAIAGDTGNKIPIKPECEPIVAKCPIDLIAEGAAKTSSSCNLCNTGSYTSSNTYLTPLEKGSLPSGIPPLMKKVLEAAGATYNVPASVLLGTMLEEGSFEHADVWKWSDETVKQFSDCTIKDPMPSCDEFAHPVTGAKGPFGFIQNWWDNYIETGGPYKAYESDPAWKEVLANIPKGNITQCNFVDAAFTAARELGEDQSHLYVPGLPGSCPVNGSSVSIYTGNDRPQSCSSWSQERVVLSRLQYGDRVCSTGIGRMVSTYKGISCGGGSSSF